MTGNPDSWDPMVGARVPRAMKEAIDGLTSYLGGAETAKRAVVIRELFRLALAMITPEFVARATAIASRFSWDRATVWTQVVRAGLDTLEQRIASEERGGRDGE